MYGVSAPHHLSAAWADADALRTKGQLGAARARPWARPEPVNRAEPAGEPATPAPILQEPGVYRPAEPDRYAPAQPWPPGEPASGPERVGRHHAPEPPGPEPIQAAVPEPPRLEHSALPWYQQVEPEPMDPFPAYQESRFRGDEEEPHRSRTPLIALGVVALAALVAAVVVGLVVFIRPHPPVTAGGVPAAPTTAVSSGSTGSGAAPTDVKVTDDGTSVTLTWTDPSTGTVPFFIEVGKPGAQLQLYSTLPQGETRYQVVGLNPRLDYCFSVIAVYGTNVVAPSNLVCTKRTGDSAPSPTR